MVVYVANPLYDAVFKYLMEDERIAKTILSALLKKKVVDVKIRRNESKRSSMAISLCRINLQVAIQEETSQIPESIIVEIEKTWLETPTLSKRQYVAEQYNSQTNSACHSNDKEPKKKLKVYILAHRIGNINLPVVYVRNHIVCDFNFHEHKVFSSEPFIQSLQQDSIIIQLPLLDDKPKNRLEKILSLFCQSHLCAGNKQLLTIEEDYYKEDEEMDYMVYRMQAAACNTDMRSQMDSEDLYLPVLESKDTQLMELDHQLGGLAL